MDRLGAGRHLDPRLTGTLWGFRQKMIMDYRISSAAEMMLVDLAVLSYFNALRAQTWIGDMALIIEHESFGLDSPTVKVRKHGAGANSLVVEERMQRLVEQIMPLQDRANKMLIRNLEMLRALRQPITPRVTVGQAEQVNVANQQVNLSS